MLSAARNGPGEDGSAALYDGLRQRLDDEALAWLDSALAEARGAADRRTADADAGGREDGPDGERKPAPRMVCSRPIPGWELRFASAGRHCRVAAPADPPPDPDPAATARVLLLHAARADADTLTRLYTRGTAAERRAVLLALPLLPVGAGAVPLVEDALRANDTRLVAAAVGPYAAAQLGAHAWRQAILKCLFTGVPVAAVAALPDRAAGDAELARMLRDYAAERTAAGRPVPDDLHHVLALATAAGKES